MVILGEDHGAGSDDDDEVEARVAADSLFWLLMTEAGAFSPTD